MFGKPLDIQTIVGYNIITAKKFDSQSVPGVMQNRKRGYRRLTEDDTDNCPVKVEEKRSY